MTVKEREGKKKSSVKIWLMLLGAEEEGGARALSAPPLGRSVRLVPPPRAPPPLPPTPLPSAPPPYLALEEPLRALCTACTMASRSMPKTRSSSWGLPLRGTWETARRCTEKPVSLTTAELTASPRPPGGVGGGGGDREGSSHSFSLRSRSQPLHLLPR